jgi:AcrR family transcriptional regulator
MHVVDVTSCIRIYNVYHQSVAETNRPEPGLRAAGVARTRRNIVAAARRHLVDSGYHRLSLEQVAADAGVTRVTIYRQFSSKLGLLDAIAEDLAARSRVVAGMRTAAGVDDPAAAFAAMVSQLCRFWSTDPDVFRRLISLAAVDPEARQVIAGREQWRYDQIATFVRRLAAADRLRAPFDPQHATAVIGAVTSFPACDEMASRLDVDLGRLDRSLLALLTSVVHLD